MSKVFVGVAITLAVSTLPGYDGGSEGESELALQATARSSRTC